MNRSILALGLFGIACAAPCGRAGDVTAVVDHGTLELRGGDSDDKFVVDAVGLQDGSFRIQPTSPTTVNGSAAAVTLDGVTRDLSVRLDAGNNEVTLMNLTVPRALSVRAGDGNDKVVLSYITVRRNVRLALGGGSNEPTIDHCELDRGAVVTGGAGVDLVKFQNSEVSGAIAVRLGTTSVNATYFDGMTVHGAIRVAAGDANDAVGIFGSDVRRVCDLRLGEGANIMNIVDSEFHEALRERCGKIDPGYNTMAILNSDRFHADVRLDFGGTGTGINSFNSTFDRDWIVIGGKHGGNDGWIIGTDTIGRDLRFSAGAGNNVVSMTAIDVGRNLTVQGGDDDDAFYCDGVTGVREARVELHKGANVVSSKTEFAARRLRLATGDGDDVVDLQDVDATTDLLIALGAGNNTLNLANDSVGDDLLVHTGDGDDTITATGNTVLGKTKFAHGGGSDTVP